MGVDKLGDFDPIGEAYWLERYTTNDDNVRIITQQVGYGFSLSFDTTNKIRE
ncbi:hypothetical protein OC709_01920 ['Planchonia careya' phytoplasma]|nr:hypothetical protein ['Planchonia careya' phytoplasma]MDO8030259.1 hypothetical protein ['Planchonia careya' phytoplasma]